MFITSNKKKKNSFQVITYQQVLNQRNGNKKRHNMSPEQKDAQREKRQYKRKNMSPEQKDMQKEKDNMRKKTCEQNWKNDTIGNKNK
jgi:hypothetical protein